ncbi:MAG: hypothetical protein NZ961_10875 [Candidatus Poribacteria bacterium]|nr:hypothetical protein [Candidatus Poribacteria bacterium]
MSVVHSNRRAKYNALGLLTGCLILCAISIPALLPGAKSTQLEIVRDFPAVEYSPVPDSVTTHQNDMVNFFPQLISARDRRQATYSDVRLLTNHLESSDIPLPSKSSNLQEVFDDVRRLTELRDKLADFKNTLLVENEPSVSLPASRVPNLVNNADAFFEDYRESIKLFAALELHAPELVIEHQESHDFYFVKHITYPTFQTSVRLLTENITSDTHFDAMVQGHSVLQKELIEYAYDTGPAGNLTQILAWRKENQITLQAIQHLRDYRESVFPTSIIHLDKFLEYFPTALTSSRKTFHDALSNYLAVQLMEDSYVVLWGQPNDRSTTNKVKTDTIKLHIADTFLPIDFITLFDNDINYKQDDVRRITVGTTTFSTKISSTPKNEMIRSYNKLRANLQFEVAPYAVFMEAMIVHQGELPVGTTDKTELLCQTVNQCNYIFNREKQ